MKPSQSSNSLRPAEPGRTVLPILTSEKSGHATEQPTVSSPEDSGNINRVKRTFTLVKLCVVACGLLWTASTGLFPSVGWAQDSQRAPGRFRVGYTMLETIAPGAEGGTDTVYIAVWYPTADPVKLFQYDYGGNRVSSWLALDGRPVRGQFPLILYSHGATGCGISSAFLTERLASEGFVVAGADYTDKYFACRTAEEIPRQNILQKARMWRWIKDIRNYQLNKGGKDYRHQRLSYRPKQARAVIDRLIAEGRDPNSPLQGIINEHRIAAVGHSFGAWTSLLIGGADPVFADSRIKAIAALSGPCNNSVYEPQELANIRVPVLFMYGSKEPEVGRSSDKALLYDRTHSPKLLYEIRGADHFTFSGGVRKEFRTVSAYRLQDIRRGAIVDMTEAFFKYFLNGDRDARAAFKQPHLGVSNRWLDLDR